MEDFYERKLGKKHFHMKSNYEVIVRSKFNQFVILGTNGKRFFRIDILSKTDTLMKLSKNVVTIPSSLWISYSTKTIYT